ncbi:hypothetical protein KR074_004106 [Drosophila pseudoananassae]|nr:hypothetical protein KR074_004106 [Drosophila pseudoananassae]
MSDSPPQVKRQKMSTPKGSGCGDPFSYEELNIIGTGAYGTVYKARNIKTGNIVAIKKVRISLNENGVPMSTLREISLLKQLNASNHDNIVKLFEVCQFLERDGHLMVLLVFEHLEQDLSDLIDSLPKTGMPVSTVQVGLHFVVPVMGSSPPNPVQRLSRELLTGVDFLHIHRIVHRDLKPQNLLVSAQGHLKIADFGLAKTYDAQMKLTSVVVTLWYRAPEVLLCQPYSSAVDIWSCACIIFEMFNRRAMFPGNSEKNQLDRIFELTGRPSEKDWPATISVSREQFPQRLPKRPKDFCPSLCEYSDDLLHKMLSYDMRVRPQALACLQHEFFKQEYL